MGDNLADLIDDDPPDYVVTSHMIEHVPNLISWLKMSNRLLSQTEPFA